MSTAPRGSILFRYIPGVGRVALPCCSPTPTLPSTFYTANGTTALTDTFAIVATTTSTVTTASRIMIFVSVENENVDTGDEHTVSMFVTANGDTSNTTSNSIARAKNGSTPSQSALSIVHRTSILQPGTYTITLHGKANENSVMNVTHVDIGAIGHLT